jgi:hypothetical protein
MKFVAIFMAVAAVLLVLVLVSPTGSGSTRCEAAGGTEVRTNRGIVCARLELIAPPHPH